MQEAIADSVAMTAFAARDAPIRTGTHPTEIVGTVEAHRDYFDVVQPAFFAGRGFSSTSGVREVVISRALWASRFESRPITILALAGGLSVAVLGERLLDAWPVTLAGRVPLRLAVNVRVALLSSLLAACAVLISGIWPLWRASARQSMDRGLPGSSRMVPRRPAGRLLFQPSPATITPAMAWQAACGLAVGLESSPA